MWHRKAQICKAVTNRLKDNNRDFITQLQQGIDLSYIKSTKDLDYTSDQETQ